MRSANVVPRGLASHRVLYFATAVGAAVRLFRLGSQSIWGDEALTLLYYTVGNSLSEVWQNIWKTAAHPPLYFLLAHYWYKLGDSEFMLRFPSMVFGVAAIPVMYALANRLFGRGVAGMAALIVALSPIHVWYSQEARMYSLQILLGLASTLFFVRAWQERRARDVILYVLFSAMGLFTHLATAFLLAAQGLFAIGASVRDRKKLAAWIGVQAVIVLAFTPWLLNSIRTHNPANATFNIGYQRAPSVLEIAYGFYAFSVGFSLGPSVAELHQSSALRATAEHWPAISLAALVFGALAILGLVHAGKTSRWAFWLLLAHLAVPTGLAAALSLLPGIPLNPRYMLVALIPYWIVLALGAQTCMRARVLRAVPAVALLLVGLSLHNHYFEAAYAKQDMRSAVALLNERAKPGDVIIISSVEVGGPFISYFKRHDVPYLGYPPRAGFVDPADLSPDMDGILRHKKRAWLILGRLWSSDPRGLIRDHFDSRLQLLESHRYPGVTVLCYSLARRVDIHTSMRMHD